MGRLGRSVLYASVLTALGVSAVGAASQGTMPGDGLYGVKLHLEEIRMGIAPPGLRDDLAAMALDLRLHEVELLAAAGRWEQLDAAATRAANAEERLVALRPGVADPLAGTLLEASINGHTQRLAELMTTAPPAALEGLQRALDASTHPNGGGQAGTGDGATDNGGTNNGGTNNGGTNNAGTNNGGTNNGGTNNGATNGNGPNAGVPNGGGGRDPQGDPPGATDQAPDADDAASNRTGGQQKESGQNQKDR